MSTPRTKALAVLLPGFATLGCGLMFICRLNPAAASDPWTWPAWLAAWALMVSGLDPAVRGHNPRGGMVSAALAVVWLLSWWLSPAAQLWQFLWLGYAAAFGRLARRGWLRMARLNHSLWAEAARLVLLGVCGLAMLHPYVTTSLVGGGDARMYAQLMADFLTQLRAGVCPVLVGQSSYAFNGDIHPLRTAPGIFYAGGLLDLLSARQLSAAAVLNLLIVLHGIAAVFLTYYCLVRLVPRCGWIAWLLTILFITSPGVLALLYSGDMMASWMSLPWLPLFFFAAIRTVEQPAEIRWPAQATISLAAIWMFHAPIGFWVSVCALPFVLWHLVARRNDPHRLLEATGLVGLFCLLTGFVFVSVLTLALPVDPNLRIAIHSGAILDSLGHTWQGFFRPVSPTATALLTDLQLSPGLWAVLVVGLMCLNRVGRISNWLLGLVILLLLLLLLPSLSPVWSAMPDVVLKITEKWPAQRFFIILSVAVPFLGLPALASFRRTHRFFFIDASLVLALACGWSLVESAKFIRRGWNITLSAALTRQHSLTKNITMSRYAHEYYGRLPRYFSNGPVEPLSQTRLLARNTLEPSVTNATYLLGASTPHPREISFTYEATGYGGRFVPRLDLIPGERQVLHFDFHDARPQGVLQLTGDNRQAEYALPDSGEERAFGAGPGRDPTLTLWNNEATAESIEIKFIRTPGQPADMPAPKLRAIATGQADLPLQLRSLIPFRLSVRADEPAWLETPKLFVPGYSARINDRPVPVALSPDGLVMLPVPAGVCTVELTYPGTFGLRESFYISIGSWLFVGLYVALRFARRSSLGLPTSEILLARLGRIIVAVTLVATLFFGAMLAWNPTNVQPPAFQADGRMILMRHFPVGQGPGTVVSLQMISHGELTGMLLLKCLDGKQASICFVAGGRAPIFGEPFPVNYLAAQRIELSISPTQHAALQVRVHERLVLELPAGAVLR